MNKIAQNTATDANDEIDLLALIGTLLDYRWLIVTVTSVFAVLGIIYALLATPIYQANALIQIEERKSGIAGLDGMDELFSGKSQSVTEIEILKSRMVVGRAVDNLKLDLTVTARSFPVIGDAIVRRFKATEDTPVAPAKFGLEQFDWGGAQLNVDYLQVPRSHIGQPLVLRALANNEFELYSEDQLLLTGTVGIASTLGDLQILISHLQANTGTEFEIVKRSHLQTILEYQRGISASERGRQSGMLNISFQHQDPSFARKVLDEVASNYVRQNVERLSAEASNSLEFLRQQLPIVRKEMEQAEARLNDYQISAKSADISIETQSVLNQIVKHEAELSALKLKQLEMDKLFTQAHPSYQTLVNQVRSLENSKKALEQRVSNLPEVQQELLRLKRDVEVSSQIYTQLLQKTQELDVARASTVGNVRIIDYAAVDTKKPVAPKRSLIVIIATLLGGILSVAIAIIHSLLNRGVESPEEIENLDLPVYASIPFSSLQIDTRGKKLASTAELPLLAATQPTDITIEAIRSLHTSLHFTIPEASNNIIMVSGPSPKVGKSFLSANLATVMAQSGKKVLLIDADMRRGHLHRYFGNKNAVGLSSLLSQQSELSDALIHSHVENLDVITRGQVPPNPSELLLSQRFNDLMEKLSGQYDIVVVDTPPVLAVADALIVAKIAGINFIVVRFGFNPLAEVRATIKRFESNGVVLKGAILNATRKKIASYYKYGYDAYQYDYQSDKK